MQTMKLVSSRHAESFLLGFIWMLFFISPFVISNENDSFSWSHLYITWLRFVPFLILSMVNHFVLLPWLFYTRKTFYFASAAILVALTIGSLSLLKEPIDRLQTDYRIEMKLSERPVQKDGNFGPPPQRGPGKPPPAGQRPSPHAPAPDGIPFWLNSLVISILILGFDIGLRTTFKWNKLEQDRQLADKERVKTELAFLRHQLSPHFFMNTLNNIHALIDIDTEEAKESIIRLSKLMRHILYDSEQEKISLGNEVSFIQSYIDLMKLRFTEKVKITFQADFEAGKVKIPPLLFTSLIENAFKYGVSYQQDSFISILLSVSGDELNFRIQNSKSDVPNQDNGSSGIGLENTRKRLDLLYSSNYKMDIVETSKTYTVHIKLPL